MISINNLKVTFGGYNLFEDLSFHISENEKIGLVGKNGAGKSTLMKIICGIDSPTSGEVDMPKDCTVGYLPQIMKHHKGRSVIDETLTAFEHLHKLEDTIKQINIELAERTDYESNEYLNLINRLNAINDTLSLESSEPPQVRAEKTLLGLGFKEDDFNKNTETFSQGWNMRIELAKILLSQPNVLLLDEPTNHLDIESIEWLEDYLKSYRGAILLVSHDRRFLDNVTSRTIEILLGHIHDYKVPYSKYVILRQERMSQQLAAYENQQKMIAKTEDFIEKFRYKPTKSNQVQSRIKALEKIERIEIDETDNTKLTVKFNPAERSGDIVFQAKDLKAEYPGKTVFSGANLEIKRGEKVAFVGRNGEGKTTLVKIIMGELLPGGGVAKIGHNVNIGYFAQNQEDILDKNDTVYGTLDKIATGDIRLKLRDILAQFLFRGEDIDKKVSVLSGGERARLGMAKLMLKSCNLLVLDEPTNHMDIRSKDILKQALSAFSGTIIIVSHDRDFLDGLVDKMYEFRNGRVSEFIGSVTEFLEAKKLESLKELERKYSTPESNEALVSGGKKEFENLKSISKEEKKLNKKIEQLEKKIADNEKNIKEIEQLLSNPEQNTDIMALTEKYLEYKKQVERDTELWSKLIENS